MQAVELLLSDARGVYIPRDFVEGFDIVKLGLNPDSWEVQTCLAGPDTDGYWDAWNEIMCKAEYRDDSDNVWELYQDGDLWAICTALMTDEEKQNFGFED